MDLPQRKKTMSIFKNQAIPEGMPATANIDSARNNKARGANVLQGGQKTDKVIDV